MPIKLLGSMIGIIPDEKGSVYEEKEEKDFVKIPIEYNDEKLHGNLADFFRLKVVYRGYAPKNTYFFLKSLASSFKLIKSAQFSRRLVNEGNMISSLIVDFKVEI